MAGERSGPTSHQHLQGNPQTVDHIRPLGPGRSAFQSTGLVRYYESIMKIGIETVIWGSRFDNLDAALDLIAASGCHGVEFSQRPDQLPSIDSLMRRLQERGLILIGFRGGTVQERISYCRT